MTSRASFACRAMWGWAHSCSLGDPASLFHGPLISLRVPGRTGLRSELIWSPWDHYMGLVVWSVRVEGVGWALPPI